MESAHVKKEPTPRDVTTFLGRVGRRLGRFPGHLITDFGPQFTAEEFGTWCRRCGIDQRFGAVGRYGSTAVIERFIKSMKNECTRTCNCWTIGPSRRTWRTALVFVSVVVPRHVCLL